MRAQRAHEAKPRKKERMSQPTIDGAPPPQEPPPPHEGGRPRLPEHLRTGKHERDRVRKAELARMHPGREATAHRIARKRRRVTSPPLPFKSRPTALQKLHTLLDFHECSPRSQVFNFEEHHVEDDREVEWDEAKDAERYLTKYVVPTKRRAHYDE